MNPVPRWRIAAGVAVLLILLGMVARFTPIYLHNLQLQSYVASVTQSASNSPSLDDPLRSEILDKAHALNLPVTADDVHITHTADGVRVDVRYFVTVNLPGYTVRLHFYPGAGSR